MSSKKINNISKDVDTLFSNSSNPTFKNKVGSVHNDPHSNDEPHKRTYADVKDYYKNIKHYSEHYPKVKKTIKQYSIYLPRELQLKLKAKATEDDQTVSDVIRSLILNHYLSDEDIKSAYDKAYYKRNGHK